MFTPTHTHPYTHMYSCTHTHKLQARLVRDHHDGLRLLEGSRCSAAATFVRLTPCPNVTLSQLPRPTKGILIALLCRNDAIQSLHLAYTLLPARAEHFWLVVMCMTHESMLIEIQRRWWRIAPAELMCGMALTSESGANEKQRMIEPDQQPKDAIQANAWDFMFGILSLWLFQRLLCLWGGVSCLDLFLSPLYLRWQTIHNFSAFLFLLLSVCFLPLFLVLTRTHSIWQNRYWSTRRCKATGVCCFLCLFWWLFQNRHVDFFLGFSTRTWAHAHRTHMCGIDARAHSHTNTHTY